MAPRESSILNHKQILQKITRIAFEIYERNIEEKKICVCGIDERGFLLAKMLVKELESISPIKCHLIQVKFDRETVSEDSIKYIPSNSELSGNPVLIVDDVLNTGRTLMHLSPSMVRQKPKKMEVVVLADRNHRDYPITADYIGISMATTLQEHVTFDDSREDDLKVYLS